MQPVRLGKRRLPGVNKRSALAGTLLGAVLANANAAQETRLAGDTIAEEASE